jgi:DNA-binding PadR family transcriptional regulator
MAYEHLRDSVTKGNLWLYILSTLEAGNASPNRVKELVKERFEFTAASITFYSVLYRLRREGLVKKSSAQFRSAYEVTQKGREELERARKLLREVGGWIEKQPKVT